MERLETRIKEQARLLGFEAAGITTADPVQDSAEDMQRYIAENRHAGMSWLADSADRRHDPQSFFPEAKSVLLVAHNYFRNHERYLNPGEFATISMYARGRDYHKVLRNKLKKILSWITEQGPGTKGRVFVDSFPIMEKPLAVRAGIGWIAKNTTLIIKGRGSYYFLGGLLLNLPLIPDIPESNEFCGSCHRCLDACPTGALNTPFRLDPGKCISYLTIEHAGEIDKELSRKMGNLLFGCDFCQIVCPWNLRFSRTTSEKDFYNRFQLKTLALDLLQDISKTEYENLFQGTPVRRTGYNNFMRNVKIACENMKNYLGQGTEKISKT